MYVCVVGWKRVFGSFKSVQFSMMMMMTLFLLDEKSIFLARKAKPHNYPLLFFIYGHTFTWGRCARADPSRRRFITPKKGIIEIWEWKKILKEINNACCCLLLAGADIFIWFRIFILYYSSTKNNFRSGHSTFQKAQATGWAKFQT